MAKGRKKPMQGAKKYSLLPLPCSKKECNAEFWVVYANGKRYCEDHMPYLDKKLSGDDQIFAALGL